MGDLINAREMFRRAKKPTRFRPGIALVKQRMEKRRVFDAAVNVGRARNAESLCAHCARKFRSQQMIYHVPGFELFFCIPCGVVWRDEIYPLLKGQSR